MDTIGLKELRQHASEYVKRAESGESMLITVAGRPTAVLGPPARKQWNSYDEIAGIFESASGPTLSEDLASIDDSVRDPWDR